MALLEKRKHSVPGFSRAHSNDVVVGMKQGGPCRVHTSDLRIYVEAVGLATFPDGSVICGPLVQHPPSPNATALNPTVLLEVTRDSSEEYDTRNKVEYCVPSPRGSHTGFAPAAPGHPCGHRRAGGSGCPSIWCDGRTSRRRS
jgi:hypothetical protein